MGKTPIKPMIFHYLMHYLSHYKSPLGDITIASDGENIVGLWFDKQKYERAILSNECIDDATLHVFDLTKQWLDIYFEGKEPNFTPPLKLSGSAFRQTVGEIMLEIPYGKTTTYGEIARQVTQKMGISSMSSQAVGGAVGHNPISIIVPCHRVMGSDGTLTGYAGGLDKKRFLLRLEGHIIENDLFETY